MSDRKLGFTFYPKDWWTSKTFYKLNAKLRYVYLELLFDMYMTDQGWSSFDKNEIEGRLRIQISDEEWLCIVGKFDEKDGEKGEKLYTSSTVQSRMKKIKSARENGKNGGAPVGNQNARKGENVENEDDEYGKKIETTQIQPKNNPNSTEKQAKEKENRKKNRNIIEGEGMEAQALNHNHPPELISGFKKFNDWIREHAPRVLELKKQITIDQYVKLKNLYPDGKVPREILTRMHNYKALTSKYIDAYLTLSNWIKLDERK